MPDGHLRDDHLGVEVDAEGVDGPFRPFPHVVAIQGLEPLAEDLDEEVVLRGLAVQEDVLGSGKARDEGELLVHVADAGVEGVEGVGETDLLAVEGHLSLETARLGDHRHAEQDVHEGALARAVLAHQAQNLALPERERNVGQDPVAEELLADVLHPEKRLCFHRLGITSLNSGQVLILCVHYRLWSNPQYHIGRFVALNGRVKKYPKRRRLVKSAAKRVPAGF